MKKAAYFFIILAAVFWGTMGFFVVTMTSLGFSRMQIVFLRAVITAAALIIYTAVTDRKAFSIHLHDIWIFLGTGICSFVFFSYCYFLAMQMTTLSVAAVLLYTSPIFVVLLSALLFREKLTKRKLLAIAITFLGCVLVSGGFGHAGIPLSGILVGLGAGLGYALYSIFGRYGLNRYSTLTVTLYTFIVAGIACLPFVSIKETFALMDSPQAFTWVALLGIITCVVPYLSYTKGLSLTETSTAAVIATLEPVVATLISVFYFHEQMTTGKIIGIFMILFSVYIINGHLTKSVK